VNVTQNSCHFDARQQRWDFFIPSGFLCKKYDLFELHAFSSTCKKIDDYFNMKYTHIFRCLTRTEQSKGELLEMFKASIGR